MSRREYDRSAEGFGTSAKAPLQRPKPSNFC
jgi:hypothetical protein